MKEKLVKFLASKWLGAVIGAIITIILMGEEKALGDMTNSWALGLITSVLIGGFAELFRHKIAEEKYDWRSLLCYLVGGIIGMIIMFIV